ncbi:hypothetical protein FML35_19065 [Klebsiella oxytoca]|uniref:Phage protein n=1 Tax=Klebsiella oxytoca TaxID=571 RepID=A0AAI9E024_KLEOX|nr:hypothetical protein [Klebsiella oxytoca]ELM5279781.1 hypothetical protein [Klebsiella oxytoca]MBZ7278755.1 hypothetical protein [Klebsiella oxytoca]MBZ7717238.1 hypothetical protein [Klebsiella oxytoca]MCW9654053.1 hypothetical protein [Klebsiella oxytoca]MDM4107309.1 hypothetical protein [Klebsiella oxytoca]
MTKSTITREWLQHQISSIEAVGITDSNTLAVFKLALAAMDSEPVGEFYEDGPLNWYQISDGDRVPAHRRIPLYRHAQPAPVVPEEMPCGGAADDYHDGYQDGWNACRAAMLQAQSSDDGEPTDDERIMAIEGINNCERCGDEGWIVGEMGITRCACSQDGTLTSEDTKQFEPVTTANKLGNSPVILDGSEDTKRLNWLDAQNKRLNEYYGTSYGWKFDANFQRNAMMLNDSNYPVMTVRQAIDEAIAAAPQEVK